MIITKEIVDLDTPTGLMRNSVYRPKAPGQYPGIIFYSEIFQETGPISRSAAMLAGHGFVVIVPEIFHELNPIGTVLGYDDEGKNKGNQDKAEKPLEDHDSDTVAMVNYLKSLPYCTGKLGAAGFCIGGHLAFRAAMHPDILATSCFYGTDIHSNTLKSQPENDSITRSKDIKGELLMLWGKQDPHIPQEGRQKIYQLLCDHQLNFTWHEFNGQHAFMRDEGERYDPELANVCFKLTIDLFRRKLNLGDVTLVENS